VIDRSAQASVDEEAHVSVPGGPTRVVVEYAHRGGAGRLLLQQPDEAVPTATLPVPTVTRTAPPDTTPGTPTTPTAAPSEPTATSHARATRMARGPEIYLPLVRRDLDPPIIDDFSDPSSGWPVLSEPELKTEYLDGEYRVQNRTAETAATIYSDLRRPNLDIQVSARSVGAARGIQGLAFGARIPDGPTLEVESQYLFVVQPDAQQWGVYHCSDTCGRVQLGNSRTMKKDGVPNTLRVTWQKPWLRVYLNGDRVWQRFQGAYDPELYHGLIAGPVDAGHDARFDDYVLRVAWEPPANADMDPDLDSQGAILGASNHLSRGAWLLDLAPPAGAHNQPVERPWRDRPSREEQP
jgi:hypothetical protein